MTKEEIVEKIKNKHFFEKFREEYPIAYSFIEDISQKSSEYWKKIGVFYGEKNDGTFFMGKNGVMYGTMSFWLLLGILSEYMMESIAKHTLNKNEFEKFQKNVRKEAEKIARTTAEGIALQSIQIHAEFSPKECSYCGHSNPPDAKYCNQCRRKL